MNIKIVVPHHNLLRVISAFKRDDITSAWKVCEAISSVEKYRQKWNKMKYCKVCFSLAEKKRENLLDHHHHVNYHIEIVSHDGDYSSVDVHVQAMLSNNNEGSPNSKKFAESKMFVRCLLGTAYWYIC